MKLFIVDAFTDVAFKGNPAGVCLVDNVIPEKMMQSIAKELNLSETAFVSKAIKSENDYTIRYFAPSVEIDFCGHATLASAKVLFEKNNIKTINFSTFYGLNITAIQENETIKMKFPLYNSNDYLENKILNKAFGISKVKATKYCKELNMILLEIENKEALLQLQPKFNEAIQTETKIKGVIVTAKSDDNQYDFYSRFFCPWIGINEDPVTGSSHSVLAKYWGNILNKSEMKAYQCSERGGFLHLKVISETELEVSSKAKIMIEGNLNWKDI